MSNSSSNVTSPSTSIKASSSSYSIAKSASNRSIFRENSTRNPLSRSRQNTVGLDFLLGEDLSNRNIGSDYQEIQIRTLTKWVNAQLRKADDSINNIKTDLRDGKKLLKLLSVVATEPAPKPERMNMRIHQLANVAQALSFLERQVGSDSMPDIGNEAIVNGDDKKTLALIFFIMLKYQIQLILTEHGEDYLQSLSELSERENGIKSQSADFNLTAPSAPGPLASSRKTNSQNSISDKLQHTSTTADAKMALLYWVRIQLEDYIAANIIPSIQDFSRSWRSGIAFCLLIHRHNPTYIPDLFSVHLSSNLADKATWHQLLKLAFSLATQNMGIEAYLEPEDLVDVDYPHEPSVMMYVSEYYRVMSAFQTQEPPTEKRARAAKRKATIVMAVGGSVEEEVEETSIEISPPIIQETLPEPEPEPIPSTVRRRNNKILQQRVSTLGKEEKAKIKADLNSKLMMQLTGHLPRGIHPTLDELLTIHETVLSFIKLNTKTIDEIPEEFPNSAAAAEYVEALEIIEEQSEDEFQHLETARKAKDTLTLPPETADDTIIRLTSLQRSQVIKLYDVLEKEWVQFMELLKTTKDDLSSIEQALINTEENAQEYQSKAAIIENLLNELSTALLQLANAIHPIEGSESAAVDYQTRLNEFSSRFQEFEETNWKEFILMSRQMSRAVMQFVSSTADRIHTKHEVLVSDFEKQGRACKDFERGLRIVNTMKSIEAELEVIQSMMDQDGKERATTNQAIQALENKVAHVRSIIYSAKQEFGDLLEHDNRLTELFSTVQTRYETVNHWVDQVRVWFIEAERIRGWIEERIQTIQERNADMDIDPLSQDFNPLDTTKIYQEHEILKRDIERFNEDDMKRLRSHVRELTGTSDHHLTPADASTIEITLSTLTILDRLINMLRKRTGLLDILKMRIEWENLIEKAMIWCDNKETAILNFIHGDARWSDTTESTLSTKQFTEQVIQTLVNLENSIAEFDKGDFSHVLDAYQDMEALENDLPRHLEARQEALELKFELLMKKSAFARKVVEQFLVVNDVVSQFKKLRSDGQKLKTSLAHDIVDANFDEKVQTFKENSLHWVTTFMKRVPYPDVPEEIRDLEEDNLIANDAINECMNDHATALAELTEDLEDLLSSHRQDLSLQQRASLVYDDMLRVTNWLEERLKTLQKFDPIIISESETISLEDEALNRLEKEHDSISSKLKHLQEHDIQKVLDSVQNIEIEMDETNSLSIDRNTLITGIDNLDQCLVDLKETLASRVKEIAVLRKRIVWETEWEEAHAVILDLARQLWDFDVRFAQYDVEGLKERRSSQDSDAPSTLEVRKEDLYNQISDQISDLKNQLKIISSDASFNELEQAYLEYDASVPEHITLKQAAIQDQHQDLNELFTYITDIMNQHDHILQFLDQTKRIQIEAEEIQNSVHVLKRETSSSTKTTATSSTTTVTTESTLSELPVNEGQQQIVEQINAIQTKINTAHELGNSFQYLTSNNWFESTQPQTLMNSVEYNAQIESLVNKRMETLTRLKDAMDTILNSYQQMDVMRSKLVQCQSAARRIQSVIDKSAQKVKQCHVDVTAAASSTQESIHTFQDEINALSKEISLLESTRVLELQNQLNALAQDNADTLVTEDIKDACNHLSENITKSLMFIQQSIATEKLVLETAEKRLIWETSLNDNQSKLDAINQQLQQYVLKKNKCVAQPDTLTKVQIEELVNQHSDMNQQLQQLKETSMRTLETDYEQVKSLFIKLPFTKSVPVHIEEQMDIFNRSVKKLQEALEWRSKELEYIHQRGELELRMAEAIIELEQQRKIIGSFVETKGRWNSNEGLVESENQLEKISDGFQTYRTSVVKNIKQQYDTLQEISKASKPGFMSESHAKKMESLHHLENNTSADIQFAKDTMIQKKQVTEFVEKTADLEREAELIRELFLSCIDTDCVAKLEDFVKKVQEMEVIAKQNILIPKRSNENDISMPTKVKDKTMNSVVQDLINTRMGRLAELSASLSTLLKSQEVFTQLQYTLKTFNQQITVCESWISSRRDILEKNVHVLDDSSLCLDIDRLRDAVSEADSIQTSMNAHDNHFTLLTKYKEKYIKLFDEQVLLSDVEKEEKLMEYDTVCDEFERVSMEWDDLLNETKEVSNALSSALLPAELNYRLTNLTTSFTELLNQIQSVDQSTVTDNQLSEWQKNIDLLESKEYDRLHSEMSDYKHNMNADMVDSLMTKLDDAGEIVLEIRAKLTTLYDSINANRLRNTHAENSDLFHKSAEMLISLIDKIQLGKFSIITDKKTVDGRTLQFKELTAAHKQIKERLLECQGFYDDSCSYYTGMRVQDVITPESQQVQDHVESSWEQIQSKNLGLSSFVTRNSKWIDACNELDKILASLEALKIEVDKIAVNNTSNTNNKIQKYDKQLLKVLLSQEELENNVKNSSDLSQDEKNKSKFLSRSQEIRSIGNGIQQKLEKRKLDKERVVLFEIFRNEVVKVSKVCEDQISFIKQQTNANPDLKKVDTINTITNAYSTALSHIQDKYRECKTKYDGIVSDQATKLIKTYSHPEVEVDNCKSELEKLLTELKSSLKIEQDYITSLKQLSYLMKFDKDISRLINDLKTTISRSYNGSKYTAKSTRTRNIPELKEFMQRYESIDKSIQEFYDKCDELKKNVNKRVNTSRVNVIHKSVDKRKEDMVKRWAEIKASADDTRERLDIIHKRQVVATKLSESLKYTDDLKERVDSLQLSGKSISVEEQELNEIQEEIDVTLKKNSVEIDSLFKTIGINEITNPSASETTLKTQREKLSVSIEELSQLVIYRRKQARTEGSITEFLGMVDQIDSEILALSKVVEETSIQNASLDGTKFNKSDLQSLLKTLVTTFKKSEVSIEQLLDKAKRESHKQFLDDNETVATRIKKTIKDWSVTKSLVSSREKELQACIKELDHEFFTKLAKAKSSPKERRSRRGDHKSKPAIHTPPGSSSRPPSNFRSTTLSTELKMNSPNNTAKRAKSPSTSGKNTKYIPDPKNELDVQLGLIVNQSPYRMKVKMVPGEAGKYWFGDEHPRLVYCRILPSKMVMVRVGGGWQELSKFMKDHGHSDGLATKSDSGETQYLTVNSFRDPLDDSPSYSVTTRSGSPMGPIIGTPIVRRGSGVSSSLTNRSSNSSSTGYLEGDKFIQTDEDGNQVALKMVRADSISKHSNFK